MEKWLSKDEIMELYLNIIYLGEGAHGVQTASYTYFGKDVSELTVAECALVAGLTQSPEGYNPYKYPEKAKRRQEVVLSQMKKLGYINEEQYNEAINQELVYKKGEIVSNVVQSYFIETAIDQVVEDLAKERGISEAMAKKMVYSDGLKIYTTLDTKAQAAMDEVYTNTKNFSTKQIKNKETGETEKVRAQSAMTIMDYHTGNVVALVGGSGEKTIARGLNRAVDSYRQPGSCIKPLSVYAPGIESRAFTAGSIFNDGPITRKNGTWTPKEWYSGWKGLVTTRDAIAQSMNIPAILGLEKVGVDYSYNFMKDLGFKHLQVADKDLAPLSLGGLNKGASVLEMTAAYGTIANNGVYIEPKFYTRVEDANGKVILEKKSTTRRVMSEQTAFIVKDLLKAPVISAGGTASFAKISGMDVATKTGTTTDSKDRYFAGFTPYYVAAVWYGYDDPQKITDKGINPAGKLWINVMKSVHKGLASAKFEQVDDILKVTVCKDSGLLPTDGCPTITEYFLPGTQPKETCNLNTKAIICKDSGLLAGKYCPETSKEEKVYVNKGDNVIGNESGKTQNAMPPTEYCNIHKKPPVVKPPDNSNSDNTDNNTGNNIDDDTNNNTGNNIGNDTNNNTTGGNNIKPPTSGYL